MVKKVLIRKSIFSAPGVPGVEYAVGRTSTNQLRKAVISTSTPLAGFSTTSKLIGTGSKTFTIDTSLTALDATDKVKLQSAANGANFMTGTVTSLVGTTLTVNVTSVGGSGTLADWSLGLHLPAQCTEDIALVALRTGSTTADFTIADWDFRGLDIVHYVQNTHLVTYSQCLFDLSNYTQGLQVFLGRRSGTATFTVSYCTFDGMSSTTVVNACLGLGLITCEYCDILAWPCDWCDTLPTAGQTTTIQYTRVVIVSTADPGAGLHSDGMQSTSWTTGTAFNLHHLTITMPSTTPAGGSGITGCINFSTGVADWAAPTSISDCKFVGGGYTLYFENQANISASATITIGERVYVGGWAFGPTYTAGAPGYNFTNLVIAGLKSTTDGSPVAFSINAGGVAHTNVYSYP